MSRASLLVLLLLATSLVLADDVPDTERAGDPSGTPAQADVPESDDEDSSTETHDQANEGPKVISGMSILGNQEAPKSLVIVPWKSSVLGESLGISTMLDDSKDPVDKDVFMRALHYYEIRSRSRP